MRNPAWTNNKMG